MRFIRFYRGVSYLLWSASLLIFLNHLAALHISDKHLISRSRQLIEDKRASSLMTNFMLWDKFSWLWNFTHSGYVLRSRHLQGWARFIFKGIALHSCPLHQFSRCSFIGLCDYVFHGHITCLSFLLFTILESYIKVVLVVHWSSSANEIVLVSLNVGLGFLEFLNLLGCLHDELA